MTPYVLLSLWAPDDEATCLAHAFAQRLHQRRAAVTLIDGDAPAHAAVKAAVEAAPGAAVVVFAHGGEVLSARSGGAPWAHAEELARLLSGRRVYAFACSTFKPQARLLFDTFANRAVAACVAVFAGHCAPVMTPLVRDGGVAATMEQPLFAMIDRFLGGEEDLAALQSCGRCHAAWDLPIELDLPSEDPNQDGAFGWSSAMYLGGFFESLRIRTKAALLAEAA